MTEALEVCNKYWPSAFEDGGRFTWSFSYEDLVERLGETVLSASDDGYQGSSYFLLKSGDRYGYLEFGWGSCSGCDALAGCESKEEVGQLFIQLRDSIHWEPSLDAILAWFKTHDWKGGWSWHDGAQEFVALLNAQYSLVIE